jgi:anti-sigma-K factor RskA
MNITEYISSGILDRYVAGGVSAQEQKEVECLSHIYPEIQDELLQLQAALEQYADLHRVAAPAQLRDKILTKLAALSAEEKEQNKASNELPNKATPPKSRTNGLLLLLNIVGLVGIAVVGYWGVTQKNAAEKANESVKMQQLQLDSMQQQQQNQAQHLAVLEQEAQILKNIDFRKIDLTGVSAATESNRAVIYWNPSTQAVFIQPATLPLATADQQYQLWAIKDGKPVDIGLLPQDFAVNGLIEMKEITGAAAFAITLEPKGGVASPTMAQMQVLGKVS